MVAVFQERLAEQADVCICCATTSGSSRCIKTVILRVDCFPLRCAPHSCSTWTGGICAVLVWHRHLPSAGCSSSRYTLTGCCRAACGRESAYSCRMLPRRVCRLASLLYSLGVHVWWSLFLFLCLFLLFLFVFSPWARGWRCPGLFSFCLLARPRRFWAFSNVVLRRYP